MSRNRSTLLNGKVKPALQLQAFNKIGRLSLINIELNLFQELESAVHWSDLVRRLYHADWFVAMDLPIFHILMTPNKDARGSRQLPASARVIWLCACMH